MLNLFQFQCKTSERKTIEVDGVIIYYVQMLYDGAYVRVCVRTPGLVLCIVVYKSRRLHFMYIKYVCLLWQYLVFRVEFLVSPEYNSLQLHSIQKASATFDRVSQSTLSISLPPHHCANYMIAEYLFEAFSLRSIEAQVMVFKQFSQYLFVMAQHKLSSSVARRVFSLFIWPEIVCQW